MVIGNLKYKITNWKCSKRYCFQFPENYHNFISVNNLIQVQDFVLKKIRWRIASKIIARWNFGLGFSLEQISAKLLFWCSRIFYKKQFLTFSGVEVFWTILIKAKPVLPETSVSPEIPEWSEEEVSTGSICEHVYSLSLMTKSSLKGLKSQARPLIEANLSIIFPWKPSNLKHLLMGKILSLSLWKAFRYELYNYKFWCFSSTLTRSQVKASGKKRSPQKGSGRARHGSFRTVFSKKGGRVFGPKSHKRNYVFNRKEWIRAFMFLLWKKKNFLLISCFNKPKNHVLCNRSVRGSIFCWAKPWLGSSTQILQIEASKRARLNIPERFLIRKRKKFYFFRSRIHRRIKRLSLPAKVHKQDHLNYCYRDLKTVTLLDISQSSYIQFTL
uniref:Large ribosomal subunit protein uL4m n=1 Tax=Chromera velia TaxID=505693 RepID=D9IXJ5_9ALVE|nr:ribosomal protein L4 [Chromera velia]ADJ66523.2 ribosomal protein L4 [Chromera velia]